MATSSASNPRSSLPFFPFRPHLSTLKITEEDIASLTRLCDCLVDTFDVIGQMFIATFIGKQSGFSIGHAMLLLFGSAEGVEYLRHRVILIFLLYKAPELDGVLEDDSILEHPFLSFFLAIMDYGSESFDKVDLLGCPKIGLREKYIAGSILTGMLERIRTRTPLDITMMRIPDENFDITKHKTALGNRHKKYPVMASLTVPAVMKLLNETTNHEKESKKESLASTLTADPNLFDLISPSFHRITPLLMPPSDDEFQFLYPNIMEPMWMETNAKRIASLKSASSLHTLSTVISEKEVSSENRICDEPIFSPVTDGDYPVCSVVTDNDEPTSIRLAEAATLTNQPQSNVNATHRVDSLLPTTPSALKLFSNEQFSIPSRPTSISHFQTVRCSKSIDTAHEVEPQNTASGTGSSIITLEKKQPLTRSEAVELLKKSLVSIVSRTEAQKVADLILQDSSLAEIVDMPPYKMSFFCMSQFQKYIDDNPTIAAAVIVDRVRKNNSELPLFFDLLTSMKISVQAMEVINKLCGNIDFPQDYLNNYIATCVRRCEELGMNTFTQCRQVRVICVFLSSLIRNRIWDVRPLSMELQAFVLKFSHIREAASLYQAILVAQQSISESAEVASSGICVASSRESVGVLETTTPTMSGEASDNLGIRHLN